MMIKPTRHDPDTGCWDAYMEALYNASKDFDEEKEVKKLKKLGHLRSVILGASVPVFAVIAVGMSYASDIWLWARFATLFMGLMFAEIYIGAYWNKVAYGLLKYGGTK